jgi:hypothetical protein
VRIFKTRAFARFARREGIDDAVLGSAIDRAERGQIDAELGGGIIKQRVARPGAGRSGGFRTVIAYRTSELSVFLYGFARMNAKTSAAPNSRTSAKPPASISAFLERTWRRRWAPAH